MIGGVKCLERDQSQEIDKYWERHGRNESGCCKTGPGTRRLKGSTGSGRGDTQPNGCLRVRLRFGNYSVDAGTDKE